MDITRVGLHLQVGTRRATGLSSAPPTHTRLLQSGAAVALKAFKRTSTPGLQTENVTSSLAAAVYTNQLVPPVLAAPLKAQAVGGSVLEVPWVEPN